MPPTAQMSLRVLEKQMSSSRLANIKQDKLLAIISGHLASFTKKSLPL